MDYSEAVAYLDAHIGLGGEPGLDRIRGLLDDMGGPHLGYPMIHVAGTNGKTSTTRFATLLCLAHGLSTGTCISPHLQRIEERFAADGHMSTEEEFALAISDVAAFADLRPEVPYSYFELLTAGAFAFFADQAVDAAVIEVGLGGRLDATNVVDADVAVLTGVDLEHTEYLGTTVEQIAVEKLAIAGPGSILVTGDLPEPVVEIAAASARDLGIEHRAYGRDFSVDARPAVRGWHMDIHGAETDYPDLLLPVHGRHQTHNAAVAVAAVEALLGRRLDEEAVGEAVASFTAPGRMEIVAREPLVMLDGAHNPGGFAALNRSLSEEFPTTRFVLVVGVMGDKDLEAMIGHISERVDAVVTTAASGERPLPASEVAARVAKIVQVPVEAGGDPWSALEVARQKAGSEGAVLVAGSIYVAGEIRRALKAAGAL